MQLAPEKNNQIEGILVGPTDGQIEVKLCTFVDDTTSLLKNKQAMRTFLSLLKKFESVSGCKLNTSKTIGLVSKEENAGEIEGIKLIKGNEKLLGVPIGSGVNLELVWGDLLSKVRKKLNFWRSRDLTLEGKAYIAQSSGISQTTYLLDLKDISKNFLEKIDKECLDFLWDNKRPKVKFEVCCLSKENGGLGMKKAKTIFAAKRIKFLIFALENMDCPWALIPNNCFKCLDDAMNTPYYALRVDKSPQLEAMEITGFYKDCILALQELNRKGRKGINGFLWGNCNLLYQNRVLEFRHWASKDLHRISDIVREGQISEEIILRKLSGNARANFFTDICKIRIAIQGQSLANLNHPDFTNILDIEYDIKESKKTKKLRDLEFKEIIQILTQTEQEYTNVNQMYWCAKLGNDFNKDDIFQNIFCDKFTPRKPRNFTWKLFYGQINVEKRLKVMRLSDGV